VKLVYVANIRLPTEKAHGLQIMQNCEAFAQNGAEVELWAARRINTPHLAVIDPFAHYGVARHFMLRRLSCLDLLPLVAGQNNGLSRLVFALQMMTFALVMLAAALFSRADVYYSRDVVPLLLLSMLKPRRMLAYEAHSAASGRLGRMLQAAVLRRVHRVITTTARLRETLIERGAPAEAAFVAHDGIREARFAGLPDRASAREQLKLPASATIVAYVGRLQTLDMDKGVGQLVEALASLHLPDACLLLVGGSDEQAQALRLRWQQQGGAAERFLYAGQVTPDKVPLYLAATDIAAMPFPWTEHFAYYASPIKLFEYMAAGCAVVASDLPSTAEVVRHDETALLYPTGDGAALAAALLRLHEDSALRARLGQAAQALVFAEYTWQRRAAAILSRLRAA
jgi:glycosyltransferase involved in cell wall biosynthesis